MDRPLTAHEAKIVLDNPRLGWPPHMVVEAKLHPDDPALPYAGWEDQSAINGARVIAIVLTSGAISTAIATAFALWVLV